MGILWYIGIILLLLVLWMLPSWILYHPSRYKSPLVLEKNVKRIPYETSQGSQVAYYVQSGHPGKHVWFLFSGNASLALHWMSLIRPLQGTFLLFDYPGYGECQGTCSPEAIQESASAASAAFEAQIGRTRWNVLGHSLGAAAALAFAAKHTVDKVVVVAPFTSILDMARRFLGPLCYLPHKHHFDNRERLEEIRQRAHIPEIHIFHGSRDPLIPVAMGLQLYDEFYDIARFYQIPGADHNNILEKIPLGTFISEKN